MKKFKRFAFLFLILVVIILAFTIYTNAKENDSGDIQEKVLSEVEFLESKLIDIFNSMNNISYENYKISSEPVSDETKNSASSDSSTSSNSSSSSGQQGKEGSSSSSSSSNETSEEDTSSQKNAQKYSLKVNGVLNSDGKINWEYIKKETETLTDSLSAITLDLYEVSLNQTDILNFNTEYNNLLVAIKNEDKEKSLSELSNIYSYIPKFLKNCSNDSAKKTIINAKEQVLKAYSILDTENWDEINSNIQNAIDTYSKLLTDASLKADSQYQINKVYIQMNELKNSVSLKDKEIFLIKYKNLLEELDNI